MIFSAIWDFFLSWLGLFYAPIKNPEMLWIIVPIYLSWIITEIFQEKHDTSFGNSISNGVIVLWVGIDWIRTTVRLMQDGLIITNGTFYAKLILGIIVLAYGFLIMYLGIRGNKNVKYIARMREVSYILIVMTPLFYEPELLSVSIILAIVLFFPVFYFLFEAINYFTPDPKTLDMDIKERNLANQQALNQPVTNGFQRPKA